MAGSIERLSFRTAKAAAEVHGETLRLHMDRYAFAGRLVQGKRVLDLACGVGYGSALLRDMGAAEVFGVDIDAAAIDEARELQQRDGVRFFRADYRSLVGKRDADPDLLQAFEARFDAVVSLETIEHLPDPVHFLNAVVAGLRSGGMLIVSAPVTPSVDANPYHLHDFSERGFRKMVEARGLRIVETMRQRQPFNPISVRKEMRDGQREGLRKNLAAYYMRHPDKLFLRMASTLRYGFVNLIDTVVAEKPE